MLPEIKKKNKTSAQQPVYSLKQTVIGLILILSAKRSFLFRKSMIEVSVNHLLLQIESNSCMLSIMRFFKNNRIRGSIAIFHLVRKCRENHNYML